MIRFLYFFYRLKEQKENAAASIARKIYDHTNAAKISKKNKKTK